MRTRRGPVLLISLLLAAPVLAACSGSAEDDVRAAARGVPHRLGRRRRRRRGRGDDGPRGRPPRCWSRPRPTCPTPRSRPKLGDGHRRGRDGHRDLDRHLGPRRRARVELRRLPANSSRPTTPGASSRRRPLVHPELGEGQHLELARSLPERAPITDAAGAPLFAPTEVVNVGVSKDGGDRPAGAGRGTLRGHRDPGRGDRRRRSRPPPRDSSSRSSRCAGRSSRRSGPRCSTCPVPSSPPTPGCSRPVPRFAEALLGRVGAVTAEIIEESQDDGSPRYADGDQVGLSGLQRAFQEQLTGTPGFTVSVVEPRRVDRRRGPRDRRGRPRAGHPAADAAGAGGPGRRRRGRGGADPAHPRRGVPPRNRRAPGGLLERARRRRQRADRPVPAGLGHEDDHRDGAPRGRHRHAGQPRRLPGHDHGRGPGVREPGPVRPRHGPVHRGARAVVQHDVHRAGADAAGRRARRGGRVLRRRQRLGAAGGHLRRRGAVGQHRHHQGRERDRPGTGAR